MGSNRRAIITILWMAALALTGRSAFADTIALAWDPSPDSTVVGYVVRVGVSPGSYTQSFDVGATTNFSYTSAVAGRAYYFSVVAYAPGPVLGLPSAEVAGFSNAPPSINSVVGQTSQLGTPVTLQLSGSDPYGDPLTFAASNLPPGISMVGGTGLLTGTPTTAGSYVVRATVSDGVLSAATTFTWTVSAPTAAAPTLLAPSGTQTTAAPEFVWQAAPDAASYQLVVSDSRSATAIQGWFSAGEAGCPTGGTCRVNPGIALAPGPASWRVQTSTSAGATAWSGSMAFTVPQAVDATAPVVAITAPTAALTYSTTSATLAVSGTASDNVGVSQIRWSTDRGQSGIATGTTSWSATVPLHGGTNVLTVSARDAANNTAAATLTISYIAAPTAVSPSGVLTTATPTFTWQPAAGAIAYALEVDDSTQAKKIAIEISTANAGCATTAPCTVSPGVQLAPGSARWLVRSIGANGTGLSSASLAFTVPDLSAPAITITAPTATAAFQSSQATLSLAGSSSDNVGVTNVAWSTSRGDSGSASGTTEWSALLTLDGGETVITVQATDAAGNVASDVLYVTYALPDTSGPTLAIATPSASPAYVPVASTTVSGNAKDPSGVARITWRTDRGASGTAAGADEWAASVPLQPGSNVVTVMATDSLGNSSSTTSTVVYIAPVTPLAPTGTVATASPTFSWTASSLATEYVLRVDDSRQLGRVLITVTAEQANCATDSTCTLAPQVQLAAGPASWAVQAVRAGIGTWSVPTAFLVELDGLAPTVSIQSPTKGSSYNTNKLAVVLAGVASDNSSAFLVTWETDRGARGSAYGTAKWKTGSIPLFAGDNVITVTVRDAAGNTATDVLTVTARYKSR